MLNIRYILRRSKEEFRAATTGEVSPMAFQRGKEQLELIKRQSTVYGLYERPIKNVLVSSAPTKRWARIRLCMA
jgi:hypothetical protein